MKKTLQLLLLALGFALLSSAAGADEVPFQNELEDQSGVTGLNPFDTFIGSQVEAIDAIFDAFPKIQPFFGVTEDRFELFFECPTQGGPNSECNQSGLLILGSLQNLDPFPQGKGDFNVFHLTVDYSFVVLEPASADVPEPSTLLLMGTGLIGFARRMRKR